MHLLGPTLFLHRLWSGQGLLRSAGEYFFYEREWVKQVSPEARQAGTPGQYDTEQLNNPMRNGEENQGYILLERIEVEEDQVYWWKLGQPCLRLGGGSRANTDAHTHTCTWQWEERRTDRRQVRTWEGNGTMTFSVNTFFFPVWQQSKDYGHSKVSLLSTFQQ